MLGDSIQEMQKTRSEAGYVLMSKQLKEQQREKTMDITRIFKWHASHNLCLSYSSHCKNLHGHTYKIEVTVSGKLNDEGMVIDFSKLDKYVNETASFDHSHLNDIREFEEENPTAENLVIYLKNKLYESWPFNGIWIKKIRVWETENAYAEKEWTCLEQ